MRFEWKCVFFLVASTMLWGQGPGQAPPTPPGPPPPRHHEGPMPGGPRQGPGGKWWDDQAIVKHLGITADQQKKMDDIWQQSRPRLIDLSATLEKENVAMEGLMKGPQLDDSRILPVIDRIAQARAELEKADARLMLAIRHVLTPEQWQKMDEQGPESHHAGPGGPIGPGAPGAMGKGQSGPPIREEE